MSYSMKSGLVMSEILTVEDGTLQDHCHLENELLQDHCHEIEEDKDNRNKARNQLLIASIVCLLFMVGEIIG